MNLFLWLATAFCFTLPCFGTENNELDETQIKAIARLAVGSWNGDIQNAEERIDYHNILGTQTVVGADISLLDPIVVVSFAPPYSVSTDLVVLMEYELGIGDETEGYEPGEGQV